MYSELNMNIINKLQSTVLNEINKAGEQLLTDKIIPVTPLSDGNNIIGYSGGDLRKSLTTKHMTSSEKVFYWISRGNIAPYNLSVHEMLGIVNWTEPGTGPKYLEVPVKKFADKYITKAIKRGLKLNGF